MINPFKLKGPFGANYSVDGDDILRTKKALHQLGHFEEKEFVNPYADARMIDGLKSFQRSRGLAPDGVMKPDGPTAKALGDALDRGRDRRGYVAEQKPKPRSRHVISESPVEHWGRPDLLSPPRERPIKKPEGVQVASSVLGKDALDMATDGAKFLGRRAVGNIASKLLPSIVGQKWIQQEIQKSRKGTEDLTKPSPLQDRRTTIEPMPSSPPPLKPDDGDKKDKEEFPAEAPVSAKTPASERPEVIDDVLKGFPNGTENLEQLLILESRGDARTKRLNNHCLEKMLSEARSRELVDTVDHVSGAVSVEEGRLPERLRRDDESVRGARSDAQIKITMKDGSERYDDLQTVDHYADKETLARRETDANDRIELHKIAAGEVGAILSVLKRRDLTEEEAMAICDQMVEDFADKHWGPKKLKGGG